MSKATAVPCPSSRQAVEGRGWQIVGVRSSWPRTCQELRQTWRNDCLLSRFPYLHQNLLHHFSIHLITGRQLKETRTMKLTLSCVFILLYISLETINQFPTITYKWTVQFASHTDNLRKHQVVINWRYTETTPPQACITQNKQPNLPSVLAKAGRHINIRGYLKTWHFKNAE